LPIATERLSLFIISAGIIGTLTAVTRNRNEYIAHAAAIARSEWSRLLDILNGIEAAVCIIGPDHRIRFANAAMQSKFGPGKGKQCFTYLRQLAHPCTEGCHLASVTGGKAARWEYADGNGRILEVNATPLRDLDGRTCELAVIKDVTQRRQLESELTQTQVMLKTISMNVVETSEAVQNDIARELHDQIGQSLLAVAMELHLLEDKAIKQVVKSSLREMVTSINQLIENLRTICNELRPVWLDDYGLLQALEVYAEEFEKRCGVSCTLFYLDNKLPDLSDNAKLAIYRVVQEALTNVMRHARASEARINVSFDEGCFDLFVIDDGIGMELPLLKSRSLGIKGMEERALAVGGALEVTSKPGKGTQVHLRIPTGCPAERDRPITN
jgi:signal transduction histidine kinase